MTRAKFLCVEVTHTTSGRKVKLQPVTNTCPENAEFFKWTPSGIIEMGILNPDVKFEVGQNYYVDFSEAAIN